MAIREILKMGDARLLRYAKEVEPEMFGSSYLLDLIGDLQDTMQNANGAGLAAPQIGVDLQVVIFGSGQINPRYPDAPIVPKTVLCNPVITPLNHQMMPCKPEAAPLDDGWEGCLSVPGLRGVVPRYLHIHYTGFQPDGQSVSEYASVFHARVVQHECDHLWGKLYPMRVKDFSQFGYTEVLFPELS